MILRYGTRTRHITSHPPYSLVPPASDPATAASRRFWSKYFEYVRHFSHCLCVGFSPRGSVQRTHRPFALRSRRIFADNSRQRSHVLRPYCIRRIEDLHVEHMRLSASGFLVPCHSFLSAFCWVRELKDEELGRERLQLSSCGYVSGFPSIPWMSPSSKQSFES